MSVPDISIVGLGIRCPAQVTLETVDRLKRVEEVLFVDTGLATQQWLETLGPKVSPLYGDGYVEGDSRLRTYRYFAARVVHAAMERGPVAFAVQGHPTVFVNAPFLIREMAELLDLSFEVLPGMSSMACLFAELMIDPGVHGVAMYEATDLLLRRRPLQPDMPTLIWQVGTLETVLYTTRRSRPERLDRFVSALRESYPDHHRVTAFFSSPHPLAPSARLDCRLDELRDHADVLHIGFTLYLPPARFRPIWDGALATAITDPTHLQRITKPR